MQYLREEILSFEKKLDVVDAAMVSDDPYCRQYAAHLLKHRAFYVRIYAEVLKRLQQHSPIPLHKMKLVDYGAGNGLLGIFARYCGVHTVYINDINPVFVQAAEKLAGLLEVDINGFIAGNSTALQQQLQHSPPDAVAGTDVIEHIYDLPGFFSQLQQLNRNMITVFTTASNTANPLKNRQLKKLQLKDEFEGGTPEDYVLYGGASAAPFVEIRAQIINAMNTGLSEPEKKILVQHTRGMQQQDIEDAVRCYMLEKKIPQLPPHPTNTCDPLTGSWTERLLTPAEYNAIYAQAGFHCSFYNGFYNAWSGGVKGRVMQMANAGVKIFGKYLAPFITITGTPKI